MLNGDFIVYFKHTFFNTANTTFTTYCTGYRVTNIYYKPADQLEQGGFPYELLLDKSHSGVELHDKTQLLHCSEKQTYLCIALFREIITVSTTINNYETYIQPQIWLLYQ